MGKIQRDFAVDLVELAGVLPGAGIAGRIGMCRLPGYEVAELQSDVAALEAVGPSVVVSLIQTEELHLLLGLMEPDIGFFPGMARAAFRHRHFPIRNGGVPASMPEFAALADDLCDELVAARTVVLHCVAGHGRTGLAAACCLVKLGSTPRVAIEVVRSRRPGTIESTAQEDFVSDYAVFLRSPLR